jgi:hypothetical protein
VKVGVLVAVSVGEGVIVGVLVSVGVEVWVDDGRGVAVSVAVMVIWAAASTRVGRTAD